MLAATGSPRGERACARSRSAGRGPARQAPEICASSSGLGGCPMLRAGARRASQWPGFAWRAANPPLASLVFVASLWCGGSRLHLILHSPQAVKSDDFAGRGLEFTKISP
jgi:hypothetical protein